MPQSVASPLSAQKSFIRLRTKYFLVMTWPLTFILISRASELRFSIFSSYYENQDRREFRITQTIASSLSIAKSFIGPR